MAVLPGGAALGPRANALGAAARAAGAPVAYTQDWHPRSTPHFREEGGVWPVHCVRGTWGAELHPALADAAVVASRAIDIPVTGIDLLVPDVGGSDYVMIEANERPGLANHEPQPTAEAFVDLLFPTLRRRA